MFSRATGMPPHAYQIQLRIMRAKLLLKKWPIASVAALTGFVDQSHFTRQFKRLVGVTPAQYAGEGKKVQDAGVPLR
jgi:AraC-like DNA-binding protein